MKKDVSRLLQHKVNAEYFMVTHIFLVTVVITPLTRQKLRKTHKKKPKKNKQKKTSELDDKRLIKS